MESLLGLAAAHWDHEPVWIVWSVRSPAFRRPGPAKAGTPNVRFMESPLSIVRMHWDHEPKMRNLFICKGSILRFMESPLGLAAVHWDDEPVWIVRPVRSPAFRRPGPAKAGTPNGRFMESPLSIVRMHWDHEPKMRNLFICKGSILRFMESPLSIVRMHWDHEPKMRNLFICKGSILRFMESPLPLFAHAFGP